MLIRNWLELLFLNSRIWTGSTLVGDGDLENRISRYYCTLTNLLLDAHASLIADENGCACADPVSPHKLLSHDDRYNNPKLKMVSGSGSRLIIMMAQDSALAGLVVSNTVS